MGRSWADSSAWRIEKVAKLREDGAMGLIEPETRGVLCTYVDALLIAAPSFIAEELVKASQMVWDISKAEKVTPNTTGCVTYCGVVISLLPNQGHFAHQAVYVRELLKRYYGGFFVNEGSEASV